MFRPGLMVAAAVGSVLALSACGGSSKPSGGTSARVNTGIKYSDCMRAHGLPNFPDPSSGGGIQLSGGINPASPAFEAAQKSCGGLLPGGGPVRGSSESRKVAMVKLAQCMRRHGLTAFPDPTSSPPSSPPSGGGIAFGGPGGFIAIPESMVQSPGFQQDAAVCGFPGVGRGGGPKASGAG